MKQPPETLKEPRKHGNMEFPCAFYDSIYTITSVSHHWHEEMEILYIEGSGYSVEVDTHDVTTEEPSFYFLNQEQLHSVELSDFLALIEHGKTTEQNGSGRQRSDALIAVVLLGNVVPSLFFYSQNAPFLNESILILSRLSSFFFHNFFC